MVKSLYKIVLTSLFLCLVTVTGCQHKQVTLTDADLDKMCDDISSVQDDSIRQQLIEKCPRRGSFHKSAVKEW
jgi:entry exclusion lipoprotein TrbK